MIPDDERADGRGVRRLSTGHAVELPLDCEFTMAGALFPASAESLAAGLPDRLSPVRVASRTGALALVSIEYHRVAGLDPYDEVAVIVPVVADARTDLPGAQLVGGDLGGWVHWLPVTTEESVALGREIWGYPKEVADIEIEERAGTRRTTVSLDGELVVALDVEPVESRTCDVTTAVTRERDLTLQSYTELDGDLLATRVALDGPLALRPLSRRASVSLGSHDRADDRRALGIGQFSLGRLYSSRMRARLHPGAAAL